MYVVDNLMMGKTLDLQMRSSCMPSRLDAPNYAILKHISLIAIENANMHEAK